MLVAYSCSACTSTKESVTMSVVAVCMGCVLAFLPAEHNHCASFRLLLAVARGVPVLDATKWLSHCK